MYLGGGLLIIKITCHLNSNTDYKVFLTLIPAAVAFPNVVWFSSSFFGMNNLVVIICREGRAVSMQLNRQYGHGKK